MSSHYDGKLISLDAANEGYLASGPWLPLGKDSYVNISFDAIQSNTPLIYNSIFPDTAEEDKALALLDAGTIDGIGIQLHLWPTSWQETLANIDAFLENLKTHDGFSRFSEVGVYANSDQEQAEVYRAITALAIKHNDVIRDFIVWGVKDPAWRGNVTLFDVNGNLKPAYYAVIDELKK